MDPSAHPSTDPGDPAEEERALARAVIYGFLSTGFRYPDEANTLALRALDPAVRESLLWLAEPDGAARDRYGELAVQPSAWLCAAREAGHVRLFGHAPEGPCPPYEGQYGESDEGLQMPHELADLQAFYRAFGLRLGDRALERPDYVAVELEYLSFLCQKQAYAVAHGEPVLARLCLDAQRTFLHDHLGRWVPAFCRRLLQQSCAGFHAGLARFALAFLLGDCRRLGVQPGSDHLRLRVAVEERDACLECPTAGPCAEATRPPRMSV